MMRGYEDNLPCTNLVLEINSSRYAYNVSLNEVHYNVVRAILTLKHDFSWDSLSNRIKYFMPLFLNYIKNESAMIDCLNAIEVSSFRLYQILFTLIELLLECCIISPNVVVSGRGRNQSAALFSDNETCTSPLRQRYIGRRRHYEMVFPPSESE